MQAERFLEPFVTPADAEEVADKVRHKDKSACAYWPVLNTFCHFRHASTAPHVSEGSCTSRSYHIRMYVHT